MSPPPPPTPSRHHFSSSLVTSLFAALWELPPPSPPPPPPLQLQLRTASSPTASSPSAASTSFSSALSTSALLYAAPQCHWANTPLPDLLSETDKRELAAARIPVSPPPPPPLLPLAASALFVSSSNSDRNNSDRNSTAGDAGGGRPPTKWAGTISNNAKQWQPVVFVWIPEQNLLGVILVDRPLMVSTTLRASSSSPPSSSSVRISQTDGRPPPPPPPPRELPVQLKRGARTYTLLGTTDMHRLTAEYPWETTQLGPLSSWSDSQLAAVSLVLNAEIPMILFWGKAGYVFYNVAYIPFLGEKHPAALGKPGKRVWLEIWDFIGPLLARVFDGIVEFVTDQLLLINRNSYEEETYFTWSYSPVVDNDGNIAGAITPVLETTDGILYKRRLRTLHALSYQMGKSCSVDVALEVAATIFDKECADIPVCGLYILNTASQVLVLKSTSGVPVPHPSMPTEIPLNHATTDDIWPISNVVASASINHVHVDSGIWDDASGGMWPDLHPNSACVFSIRQSPTDHVLGVCIMGLNPRKQLDGPYREFCEQLQTQLANGILQARAIEVETQRAEELKALDTAKTAFFANVSHDFRTPLTLILGPLTDLLAGTNVDASTRTQLQVMNRATLRLLKLVNTVLDFAGLESGRTSVQYVECNLASPTVDAASMFRAAIEKGGLKFTVDVDQNVDGMWVDLDMWDKIVCNLISNAYKFTLQGEIIVTLRRHEKVALLSVQDTGCGIAQDAVPKLFQRFYRVAGSKGRSHEGSGIGLALAMELVQLHSGRCWAESKVGVGTTIFIEIPIGCDHLPKNAIKIRRESAPSVVRENELNKREVRRGGFLAETAKWSSPLDADVSSTSPRTSGTLSMANPNDDTGAVDPPLEIFGRTNFHILLADDNADMRDYVSRLLLQSQYQVTVVSDGAKALESAIASPPDLILSDIMMPNLDGVGLLRAIRQNPKLKYIPMILLSARAGEEAKVQGLELGADDYLVKPFSRKELLARVHTHLELGLLRRNLEQALLARESEFKLLCQMAPVGISRGDGHDSLTFVNETWRDIMGMEAGRLSSSSSEEEEEEIAYPLKWMHKVHPDDSARLQEQMQQFSDLEARYSCEFRLVLPNRVPSERHVVMHCAPVTDRGKKTSWFSALVDVTSMRQLERERLEMMEKTTLQERRRANEADENRKHMESFTDIICHEIRNPLSGILQNAELLRESMDSRLARDQNGESASAAGTGGAAGGGGGGDALHPYTIAAQHDIECLSAIVMCARHQQVITDDVLNLSKLRSRRVTLNPSWFRPQDILLRVVRMFKAETVKKGIEMVARFTRDGVEGPVVTYIGGDGGGGGDMPAAAAAAATIASVADLAGDLTDFVYLDPDRLSQILFNLLSNACKFTEKAPQRRIEIHFALAETLPPASRSPPPPPPPNTNNNGNNYSAAASMPATPTGGRQSPAALRRGSLSPPHASAPNLFSSNHNNLNNNNNNTNNNNNNNASVINAKLAISVSDTGIGMTPEEQAALFQRFTQAHTKTYKEYGGSGLGLFICKELVEYMNGTISASSTWGEGTVFRCDIGCERRTRDAAATALSSSPSSLAVSTATATTSLPPPVRATTAATAATSRSLLERVVVAANPPKPTTTAAALPTTPTTPTTPPATGLRVLIVEDNVVNQRVLSRQLEIAGIKYAVANNGIEAVAMVSKDPRFDCILMDVEMPDMGGIEATERIRQMETDWAAAAGATASDSSTSSASTTATATTTTTRPFPRLPILGLSGNARDEYRAKAIKAGMSEYMVKPYDRKLLFAKIFELAAAARESKIFAPSS
ncbi:hypothetical protein HDU87_005197 [Geranomyces variabilis]|uniref:histidine kinase n=1 Tax=Geranomyces variabilis TaxID=109894 RepID=A0AAD5TJU4_9FUNG|nr:hypothetical protein HDU87_005197 [Geranomyces variabilis]